MTAETDHARALEVLRNEYCYAFALNRDMQDALVALYAAAVELRAAITAGRISVHGLGFPSLAALDETLANVEKAVNRG